MFFFGEQRLRVIGRIGEGTFSVVEKAEVILENGPHTDVEENKKNGSETVDRPRPRPTKRRRSSRPSQEFEGRQFSAPKPLYLALKRIHSNSSPFRVLNELECLRALSGKRNLIRLRGAFRRGPQPAASSASDSSNAESVEVKSSTATGTDKKEKSKGNKTSLDLVNGSTEAYKGHRSKEDMQRHQQYAYTLVLEHFPHDKVRSYLGRMHQVRPWAQKNFLSSPASVSFDSILYAFFFRVI